MSRRQRFDEMAVRGIRLVLLLLLLLSGVGVGLFLGIRPAPAPEPESAEPDLSAVPAEADATRSAEATAAEPAREELRPADGGTGTSVAAPPPDSAPLRGLLTDTATGEPLPFYLLRVTDSLGKREDIFTDEHGRYAAASPVPSGPVRIQPMDSVLHPRSLPEIVREHRAEEGALDLSVPSGPTFRLSITPADAVPPTELRASLHVAGYAYERGGVGDEPVRTPLGGEAPWVRFAPVSEDFDRAEGVELASDNGLWVGWGAATAVRGVVPEIVQVALESRGVLQGRVVDEHGAVVAGAHVFLANLTTSKGRVASFKETDAEGRFRMVQLREGSGTLTVQSLRHKPQEVAVRLVPGQIATQDFVLETLATAGDIRGRIESETGTYAPSMSVTLRVKEGPAVAIGRQQSTKASVAWQEIDGRKVGVFEFLKLPEGKYELLVSDSSWLRWESKTIPVVPPSSDARFLVHDAVALADFAFRPRDADNGLELGGAIASIESKNGAHVWKKLAFEAPVLERFPVGVGFRWRLDLDGYRPKTGDEKDFAVEETRGGRAWRFAEVQLERGWEETFRIQGSAKRKPLAGATVRLDGRDAGTSGHDGLVTVRSPDKPRVIEVVYRDWTPQEPVVLRPAGRRNDPLVVRMVAPPSK